MADTVDTSKSTRDVSQNARSLTAQAQGSIEKQRAEARQQAEQNLDREAIAAIEETQRAIDALNANTTGEALAAIERATGKVNVLLARNPATALIPVSNEVVVFDTAPADLDAIREIAEAADAAVALDDFPTARVLLYGLMSELRVRTYNLPLATYPDALTEAARLIGEKSKEEARSVLMTALGTLVVVDQVTPLPLLLVREAINQAQELRDRDKEASQALLEVARHEMERSISLGYAAQDTDYKTLRQEISNLEKQLKKNNEDTSSLFSRLSEKFSALLKRQSEGKVSSQSNTAAQSNISSRKQADKSGQEKSAA